MKKSMNSTSSNMKNTKTKLYSAVSSVGKRPWLLAAGLCVLTAVAVMAASTTWKLYSFNSSGRALRAQKVSYDTSLNQVSFTFPETSDAAYLTSAKVGAFGNLASQTLQAKAWIVDTGSGTTFANYPGCTESTTEPTVGLYFSTKGTGGFDPSIYWWSSTRIKLSVLVNNPTALDTALTQGLWTDYNGQSDPVAFAAAVANVVDWGVSFGGDCFYANGVGTPTGSADFYLQVTP
jgi:hypothetical protein